MAQEQVYDVRTRDGRYIRLYPRGSSQFKVFGDLNVYASINSETNEVKFFAEKAEDNSK